MKLPLSQTLRSLPPEWPGDLVSGIRKQVVEDGRAVVVLDDDPTGTQTVYDVPVLTEWSVASIQGEFAAGTPLFFILTNSRSLTAPQAEKLAREIGANLLTASRAARRPFTVISRSDSTLRGHYPTEVSALGEALEADDAVHVIIPFFEEGGRYTIDDVHYVAEGDSLVPAAETPFARDASFGYTRSNLREWVEEKIAGRVRAKDVASLSLENIRRGGPDAVAAFLSKLAPGSVCVVNGVSMRDMEVVAAALMEREKHGQPFLFRTAASFVRARAGLPKRELLSSSELSNPAHGSHGGLVVVGSYVPKTTEQLGRLLDGAPVHRVELDVPSLLDETRRTAALDRAVSELGAVLAGGGNAVLFTSRTLITGASAEESLRIGGSISRALVEVVKRLAVAPRFLVAKGGITSSDVATKGMDVRRALVKGQILPGIPVWELGAESRFPGMNYVVFPGNVGGPDAMLEVYRKLS